MNKRNFLITAALSAAFCFFGTANAAETLKIGASPVPHADILKVVQPELAKKGIDLKIIEFSDYVQPNLALSDKDLDANFFQHLPYLDAFSKDHRLNLVSAGAVNGTPLEIIDNPKRIRIVEVEAATLPRALDDLDAAVINSNYALGANLNPTKDAIAIEAKDSPYANVVAVRAGNENKPAIKELMSSLHSPEVKKFIEEKYNGAVVPAF